MILDHIKFHDLQNLNFYIKESEDVWYKPVRIETDPDTFDMVFTLKRISDNDIMTISFTELIDKGDYKITSRREYQLSLIA